MKLLIFLLIFLVLIGGCTQQTQSTSLSTDKQAEESCIRLCNYVKSKQSLSNGPCLSDNNPQWNVNDWVCDVAHSPRQTVDDLLENQCQDFREGKAHHFVEVDENCSLIKVI